MCTYTREMGEVLLCATGEEVKPHGRALVFMQ